MAGSAVIRAMGGEVWRWLAASEFGKLATVDLKKQLLYAFEHGKSGVAVVNVDGSIRELNGWAAALTGNNPEGGPELGPEVIDLIHPEDVETCFTALTEALLAGSAGPVEFRIRETGGTWRWIQARATHIPDPVDPVVHLALDDVTAVRATISQLAQAHHQQSLVAGLGDDALGGLAVESLIGHALDAITDNLSVSYVGVLLDDGHPDGLLLVAARGALEDRVGTYRRPRAHSVVSQPLQDRGLLVSGNLATETRWGPPEQNQLVGEGIVSVAGAVIETRTGPPGLITIGAKVADFFGSEDLAFLEAVSNVLASAIDADHTLQDVRHNSLHDSLSGLPNRALVLDRLQQALAEASRRGTQVAVLVCDIDQFKFVNDGMGHAAGDAVLRVVANRLRDEVRPGDTVGRMGGDEFVVVCPNISDVDAVVAIAKRLATSVSETTSVLGSPIAVTVSVGIAIAAADSESEREVVATELLRDADAAMYHAKAEGRNRYRLFDDEMRTSATRRINLSSELRQAMSNDELVLHYQPVLSIGEPESVVGVEALVRWQHPQRGLLGPGMFLNVARDMGMLGDLGAWVLSEAAMQTASWVKAGWWGQRWVAINLAPVQVVDPELTILIDQVLEGSGIDPGLLRFELTEDALVSKSALTLSILEWIRQRGIGISVDDFGTGYSSLAYLKRLPVDMLKLDQSFVRGFGQDADDTAIATAVVAMGEALDLQVIAEGVETPRELELLRELGFGMAQGFLFTPALPADQLRSWIVARE